MKSSQAKSIQLQNEDFLTKKNMHEKLSIKECHLKESFWKVSTRTPTNLCFAITMEYVFTKMHRKYYFVDVHIADSENGQKFKGNDRSLVHQLSIISTRKEFKS